MVSKATKICKLIVVSFFLFFTSCVWSFFYHLEKNSMWDILVGFPFIYFKYDFMGNDCQNFIWSYDFEMTILNSILCILFCYFIHFFLKKSNKKIQQKFNFIFEIIFLPILIFCSISFFSFFGFEKESKINDILIGFPLKFYEYKYIENCSFIIKKWDLHCLIVDFLIFYIIYCVVYHKILNKLKYHTRI